MKLIRPATAYPLPSAVLQLMLLGLALGLNPQLARAALGDQVSSVENDRIKMKATLATTTATLYTVHELQSPNGTIVREYVSNAGIVFAVAWQGPFQPDFQQLLGSYFDVYSNAPRSPSSSRNRASIEQDNLVVHVAGHARAFVGQAYDPLLLPAGINTDEIR